MIDVRADERIGEQDAAVFAATGRLSAPVGWEYQWVGELGVVHVANLRWLSGYRHPRFAPPELTAWPGGVFAEAAPLLGDGRGGDPVAVLPVLFEMLWRASWPRSWNATCWARRRWCMPAVAARAAGGTARLRGWPGERAGIASAGHDRLEIAWVTVALRGLRVRADAWARVDSPHREAHRRL